MKFKLRLPGESDKRCFEVDIMSFDIKTRDGEVKITIEDLDNGEIMVTKVPNEDSPGIMKVGLVNMNMCSIDVAGG